MAAGFRDLLAFFGWKSSGTVVAPPEGPWRVVADVFLAGAQEGELFTAGASAGDVFLAGAEEGEVHA